MPRPTPVVGERADSLIREYLMGDSTHVLARRYKASRAFIKDLFIRCGVPMRTREERQERLPCRQDAFACAEDDPEAAYWCGMLMADGCVHNNGRGGKYVILSLCIEDGDHVERFRRFLGAKQRMGLIPPNGKGGESISLTVGSRQMFDDLGRYGVLPRKTHTARALILERNRYFWAGCIDGDGSLGYARRGKYRPRPVLQFCGAGPLVTQFADYCRTIVATSARPWRSKFAAEHWGFALTCSRAVDVIRHLYTDNPFAMERKAAIARDILAFAGENPVRHRMKALGE